MQIVFWSTGNLSDGHTDRYIICKDNQDVEQALNRVHGNNNTSCWGVATITNASEPHWDGSL